MIKRLLAIRLRSVFLGAFSGKDKKGNTKPISKGKLFAFSLIYLLFGVCVLYMAFSLSYALASALIGNGAADVYFGLFFLLSFSLLFLLSIFETKSELFECKDNDLLLSMPIKPSHIIISRIFSILIYNFVIEALIAIPVLVSYLIFGGSATVTIGALFVFLTLPLMATALSCGVGYAIHLLSVRFAVLKNIAVMVFSLGFLALYFLGYNFLINNFDNIIAGFEENAGNVIGAFGFVGFIGSCARFSPISFIAYVLLCSSSIAVTLYIISKKYFKIIGASYSVKKQAYIAKTFTRKTAFSALVRKEFAKFTSSPTYMLNGALGLLFQLIAAIVIAINGDSLFNIDSGLYDAGLSYEELRSFIHPIFITVIVFCEGMNLISASALSLEGKNLWILKSIPIKEENILFAKATPNAILNVCASVISGTIISIGTKASFIQSLFCILIPSACGILFAFAGIAINVLIPKMEFINEAQVIKQSMATFVAMMFNMFVSLLILVASVVSLIIGFSNVFMLAALCIVSLMILVLYFLIKGPLARKYATL